MFKKVLAVTALLFASVTPVHAEDQLNILRSISWADSIPTHESPIIYSLAGATGSPCDGGWSARCDPKSTTLEVVNFLPNCDLPAGLDRRIDCIDSVFAEVNGKQIKGERVENQNGVNKRESFEAKPEFGIAKASAYEIYKFAGLSHAKGDLFMVYPWSSKWIKQGPQDDENVYVFLIAPAFQDTSYDCSHLNTANNLCWSSGSFSENTKFTLNVRFAVSRDGWFSGRITDPVISISKASDSRTLVSITGSSQPIPSIIRRYQYNITTERDEWSQVALNNSYTSWDATNSAGKRYSMGSQVNSDSMNYYEQIVSRVKSFNDANVLNNVWRVESRAPDDLSNAGSKCSNSSFTGVVSSNSMTFTNQIPTWDATTGSLVYNVASPHTALGKEFQGRYDLLISEEVAKCLWGLKNLSPLAEINVTSASGEKKLFTASNTVINGFYKFTAAGFTFSTNKISVKLVSKSTSTPVEKPTVIPKTPATTITCIKGKVQKKVTAVKPKCPTGYKKK
jgi:hypothetical protein